MKWHLLDNGSFSVGSFDWDANLLLTSTPHDFLDTQTGDVVRFSAWEIDKDPTIMSSGRYEFPEWDMFQSFMHATDVCGFLDHRSFDGFIDDTMYAVENNTFSPSFGVWKNEFLIKWRVFNILTARWNAADNLEKWVRLLNQELLSDEEKDIQIENIIRNYGLHWLSQEQILNYYFKEICDYYPCSNTHFWKWISNENPYPDVRKARVMKERIIPRTQWLVSERCKDADQIPPIAIGFSDDSVANVVAMWNMFMQDKQGQEFLSNNKARLYFSWWREDYNKIKDWIWKKWRFREVEKHGEELLQVIL